MQDAEIMLKELKKAKSNIQQQDNIGKKRKVTFAPDVVEHQREFTPYQKVKKQFNPSKMKHKILN